jgi:hypothetical protein
LVVRALYATSVRELAKHAQAPLGSTDSEFRAGCPVLAASVEDLPADGTAPRDAAAAAFGNWTSILAQSLSDHGATDADHVAILIVAAVEGSVAMCRAQRSTASLDHVAAALESVVAAHLPQR